MSDVPSQDISDFDRTNSLNSSQFAAAREGNSAAKRYFSPPFRPAPSAAAAVGRFMRPTLGSAVETSASTSRQRQAVVNVEQAGQAVRSAQTGLSSAGRSALQQDAQASRSTDAWSREQTSVRNAGFAQQLGEAKGIGGAIPQAAPAPVPAAPPADAGSAAGFGPGHPFYAQLNPSGPAQFGPGHPFYAQLIPPKPATSPAPPAMPTQAPTAGLDLTQHFLATPGGKLASSAVGGAVDAVGKALAEAAKPRQSPAPAFSTEPGWRSS